MRDCNIDLRILEDIAPNSVLGQRWEKQTKSTPTSGFIQSLYWVQVKKQQGLTHIHIGLFENDALIGGAIFYTSQKRNGWFIDCP